jgi:hypothetical protein
MKLLVIILNKTEVLEYLLEGLSAAGIGGATIIQSSGLAMTLSKMDSGFLSASIRSLFTDEEEDNRTILSVIKNNQLEIARKVVYNTVGDLSRPNTGILFTVPLDFVEGTRKNRLTDFSVSCGDGEENTENTKKDNKGNDDKDIKKIGESKDKEQS